MKRWKLRHRCIFLGAFFTIFLMVFVTFFVSWYETKSIKKFLVNQTETIVRGLHSPVLAFLYELSDWVHLFETLKALQSNTNITYVYLTDKNNLISVGINGLEDPQLGKNSYPWEKTANLEEKIVKEATWHKLAIPAQYQFFKKEGGLVKEKNLHLLRIPLKGYSTNEFLGELRIAISGKFADDFAKKTRNNLYLVGVILTVFSILVFYIWARQISSPIEKISMQTASVASYPTNFANIKNIFQEPSKIEEIEALQVGLKKMFFALLNAHQNEKLLLADKEVTKTALQVAHDIRSPLSSIQAALGYLEQMKIEDPKSVDVLNLLQLSTKRLTGIANDLLKKHKGDVALPGCFSIHQVLDELIGEFHAQKHYQCIEFVKQYSSNAIWLEGNVARIQRAFGNIIKNAAEVMLFDGGGGVRAGEWGDEGVILIKDTGPGMMPEKLERVLQGGFTEGKEGGHGIGMKVVKETIEEHGGKIRGQSIMGGGTTFFINFPILSYKSTSEIFILTVYSKEPVLVIDDDPSLREQWRLVLKEMNQETILCESWEDFRQKDIANKLTKTAIVDYHYNNSEMNGGWIIEELQKGGFKNLYLCTAEYWKPSIQKLAQELRVPLCPKPLPMIKLEFIAEVEQEKQNNEGLKVLVVDDDEAIRSAWELVQNKLKIKQLHCYPNLEALQQNGTDLKNIDLAFVDKNIQDSAYNGAEVIEYLSKKEVKKIILASGENADVLSKDPQYSKAHHFIDEKIPKNLEIFFN